MPLLLAGVLALDRMEPEPRGNLVFAFMWGAGIAVLFAGLLNSLNLIYVENALGDPEGARNYVATFGAPLVEESMKEARPGRGSCATGARSSTGRPTASSTPAWSASASRCRRTSATTWRR